NRRRENKTTKRQEVGRTGKDIGTYKRGIRVLFWNIAGLLNKTEDFWRYVETFDIVGLEETWVDEKSWKKVEGQLPSEFRWKIKEAVKEKKGEGKGWNNNGSKKRYRRIRRHR